MTRTGQAAIDYARGRVGPDAMPESGYCLAFVRECFDVASYYGSAIDAWNGAQAPHPGDRNPPAAVPLYFRTPSQYDHVVFWAGGDEIETTFNDDVKQYVGNAIARVEVDFEGEYLGWAEDINGVTVYSPTGAGAGEDLDMTPDEVRTIVQQESTNALRAEGVSGAGIWSLGQYPNGSYTVGSQAQKLIHDTTGELLTINGIVGAADGHQEWAQVYVREIVAEETAKALAAQSTLTARGANLFVLALVVLIAVVGGVAVGVLASTQAGVVAGVATIVGGLLAVVLRNLPRGETP